LKKERIGGLSAIARKEDGEKEQGRKGGGVQGFFDYVEEEEKSGC